MAVKVPQKGNKCKTIKGYILGDQLSPPIVSDKKEQDLLSQEVKTSASRASKLNLK